MVSPLARGDEAKKADLDRLAGNWKVTSLLIGGQELLNAEIKAAITGDRLKFGDGKDDLFSMTIDPGTSPKVVDILTISGNNKGDQFEGIYKLEGDQLEMCIRTPAGVKDRPTEFSSPANSGIVLIKMERVKE